MCTDVHFFIIQTVCVVDYLVLVILTSLWNSSTDGFRLGDDFGDIDESKQFKAKF